MLHNKVSQNTTLETELYRVPNRIENNYDGFIFFAKAFDTLGEMENKKIIFNFSNTTWFEANLVAVFSSLIEKLKKQNCKVGVRQVSASIKLIFKKNGFYDHYNLGKEEDVYDSTIPFKIFDIHDGEGFTEYLNEEVISKIQLPLTKDEIRYFKKCLQEVFENASMHAGSDCVYTCGQYYHQKQKVAFTIVDIGETIGKNVRKKIPDVVDCDAIEWATQFGNTTKVDKDGGIGLHFLKEYLHSNGKLQIVSGNGYWEQSSDTMFIRNTSHAFEGTVVNLISNLNYDIKKEIGEIEF